jgi:quinol-cytochrome oxidoreductase complex cytochrome b subunit
MMRSIYIVSLIILYGIFTLFFVTFLLAYSDNSKVISIHINDYGEANLELIFLVAGFIAINYCIYSQVYKKSKIVKDEKIVRS